MSKKNPHWGSTLDDFLHEEGIRDEARGEAAARVIAWQLQQEMKKQGITKSSMAERMNTSRMQLDRILNGKANTTIESLQRVASLVGRQLRIELV